MRALLRDIYMEPFDFYAVLRSKSAFLDNSYNDTSKSSRCRMGGAQKRKLL